MNASQAANQPASKQPASQTANQPGSQPASLAAGRSAGRSASQEASQSARPPSHRQPVSQPVVWASTSHSFGNITSIFRKSWLRTDRQVPDSKTLPLACLFGWQPDGQPVRQPAALPSLSFLSLVPLVGFSLGCVCLPLAPFSFQIWTGPPDLRYTNT